MLRDGNGAHSEQTHGSSGTTSADVVSAGAIWQARQPRKDGTRKQVVVESATRVSVLIRDAKTGEKKRMQRWAFLHAYEPSGSQPEQASLWSDPAPRSHVVIGPEMRKLKKALDGQPRDEIVKVTWKMSPSLAAELVATAASRNRTSSAAVVNRYADDMTNGRWVLTSQGVILGPDMEMIDGEHRCRAIMSSGVEVEMTVSQHTTRHGCEAARVNIDGPRARTKGDVLEQSQLVGKRLGKQVAATIDAMRFIDARISDPLSKMEAIEVFKQRKASIEAVHSRVGREFHAGTRGALVIAHMVNQRSIEELIDAVVSRVGYAPDSAAQAMAKRLVYLQTGRSKTSIVKALHDTLALAYAHVKGRPMNCARGRSGKIDHALMAKATKHFLGDKYRARSVNGRKDA